MQNATRALPSARVWSTPAEALDSYAEKGFCVVSPVVSPDAVRRAAQHAEAVVDGEYETGVPPGFRWSDPGARSELVKIDQPHYADDALFELFSEPGVVDFARTVSGASFLQVWAAQLLYKPSGHDLKSNVGWHQDHTYWKGWMAGETFTVWIALTDVGAASGPVRFVAGSHRWGSEKDGDFFSQDLSRTQSGRIPVPDDAAWTEIEACMPAGGASLHSPFVLHGSGPNTSGAARISLAVHFRTENSRVMDTAPEEYPGVLDDPRRCPVVGTPAP
jgi:hypothetical protein